MKHRHDYSYYVDLDSWICKDCSDIQPDMSGCLEANLKSSCCSKVLEEAGESDAPATLYGVDGLMLDFDQLVEEMHARYARGQDFKDIWIDMGIIGHRIDGSEPIEKEEMFFNAMNTWVPRSEEEKSEVVKWLSSPDPVKALFS